MGSSTMSAELELTDAQFRRVANAFVHLRLGDEGPPFMREALLHRMREFLVARLRAGSPALADRISGATDEQVEHLLDRVRLHQASPE